MNVVDFVQSVLDAAGACEDIEDLLGNAADDLRDVEIRFATQESYPLTALPRGRYIQHESNWDGDDNIVWVALGLVPGSSDISPYAPRQAFREW